MSKSKLGEYNVNAPKKTQNKTKTIKTPEIKEEKKKRITYSYQNTYDKFLFIKKKFSPTIEEYMELVVEEYEAKHGKIKLSKEL